MDKQDILIGVHPQDPNPFGKWLVGLNHSTSTTQCHRSLTENKAVNEDDLLDWISDEVIKHHYKEDQLARLKKKYSSLGFSEYAEQHRMIPNTDKVRKGNLTEILLCEYVINSTKKPLLNVFRFRYSQNVDQSMKGDDVLLVDFNEEDENIKIYLGEAKFRQTPDKAAIDDISNSLSKDTKPLSFTFFVERLLENDLTREVGNKLDEFIIETVKRQGNIIYTGLLLSNMNISSFVEKRLDSDNPNLVFISLGVDDPKSFMEKVFKVVEYKLSNPTTL